eukprot:TRINITY_DN3245_c0_g1_i2.p2 TRINITY_DN3245_c0_g1~~TRINITY_DN3245_c0_g1_i2.p2  ORF type:complete len:256 (+),score=58.37 TRINITY_DN3245_c0_g1_i2:3-770(+)
MSRLCFLRLFSRVGRGSLNQDYIHSVEAKDWFNTLYPNQPLLTTKRVDHSNPLLVFLEGPAGSGKSDVLSRLSRMGYQTHPSSFFSHCQRQVPILASQYWSKDLLEILEESQEIKPKNNVVFVERSFLSQLLQPSLLEQVDRPLKESYWKIMMEATRGKYNTAVLLCEADPAIKRERIAKKFWFAEDSEKALRRELGEEELEEFIEKQEKFYRKLKEEDNHWFESKIFSTDSQQATAAILKLLGIPPPSFSLPSN